MQVVDIYQNSIIVSVGCDVVIYLDLSCIFVQGDLLLLIFSITLRLDFVYYFYRCK